MQAVSETTNLVDLGQQDAALKDYITLLKPRVMSLVVFTGVAGILLAPGNINLFIAIVATFCIALGSGAAGAINMWYEKDIDKIMQRTKNRPIPSGRVRPEHAIEFAVVLAVASVLIMMVAVNYVAAAILLVAILFYVFIYTIWLKPRTTQNIVIGGAAGAFPPMIGWAAVTNNVSIEPIILFLIIFMWTPPHFWALALYKSEDYKKANIPMLPVVSGRFYTQKSILVYTLVLVLVSFLPYITKMSSFIYLTGAFILGGIFIKKSFSLFKEYTEAKARNLFFYSISYLFFLFVLLIVDKYCL